MAFVIEATQSEKKGAPIITHPASAAHTVTTVVVFCAVLGLIGCDGPKKPPPTQIIDAPLLSEALKWLGGCGVICSFLGATALIIASRRPFKDKTCLP
jgi:hypothetical protein